MRWLLVWALVGGAAQGKEIITNAIKFGNAPDWVTESMLDRASGRIEDVLEWSIRRVSVFWHSSAEDFKTKSHLNFVAAAYFNRGDGTVHLGPEVNRDNFDRIFGHELVHAVFFQKYKGAIPVWLEEGLANYLGRTGSPDYKWLAAQRIADVTALKHPNRDATGSKYHYQASTAAIEMIASRCSLKDLLQLSVGAKMTTYLSTYCEIADMNAAFRDWVRKKGKEGPGPVAREKRWWEK